MDRDAVLARELDKVDIPAEIKEYEDRTERQIKILSDIYEEKIAKLRQGDKSLVGNSAYRRYLKTPDQQHFTIDEARVAEDARYDGLYVLRPNLRLHPLNVMLRYRDLLVVEHLFRSEKALLATRPIYHQTDAAIRGHVFCSFLALVLRKELEERLTAARLKPEWRELLADLDRLAASGFVASEPALFVWEGVVYFLLGPSPILVLGPDSAVAPLVAYLPNLAWVASGKTARSAPWRAAR